MAKSAFPTDVVANICMLDLDGETLCDFPITRAVFNVLERAVESGRHGLGMDGVLGGILYDAARRLEPPIPPNQYSALVAAVDARRRK
jgi:hypothetical protein